MGVLSFNGNKIMTTGGGGAILTNDSQLAKKAKHITTTAKIPHAYTFTHDEVAYNYRLPNINAALGCAQLEQLTQFIQTKRNLAKHYQEAFANLSGLRVIEEPNYAKSNYWLNAFILDDNLEKYRDRILETLIQHGVMARPLWNLQHTLPMYQHCPRMSLTVCEKLHQRLIKLPSSFKFGMELHS